MPEFELESLDPQADMLPSEPSLPVKDTFFHLSCVEFGTPSLRPKREKNTKTASKPVAQLVYYHWMLHGGTKNICLAA